MDYLEKARRVLDVEIFELQRLRERLDENFARAVELIKGSVEARGKVVVLGVGKSGHIGSKIAATLTSTGSPAVVLDSLNALHGDLGMVADGDVVLALSASGETEEMLRILPAIARFQVQIIADCGDAEFDPRAKLRRFSRCEHRAGSVSAKSRADLEHDGHARARRCARHGPARGARFSEGGFRASFIRRDDRAQPAPARPPNHAAAQRARARRARSADPRRLENDDRVRAGAAVVAGEDGNCSEFSPTAISSRHFQTDPQDRRAAGGRLMTLNPVTVHQDKLAVEVLNLLERHRIDDLVVVDDNQVPVGIVDSQDLTKLKLLVGRAARALLEQPLALTALNSQPINSRPSSWPPQTISEKEWQ